MLRKILSVTIVASLLAFGGIANAITFDEAKAQVEKQATEKRLTARERTEAVTVLQNLVEKGVPVEHASRVVDACMDKGIRGKELASIARSIESATPDARDEAATVAAAAVAHNYRTRDVVKTVEAVNIAVKGGAKPETSAKVVTRGIDKGLSGNAIKKAARNYGTDIKEGTPPEKAMERATSNMDRIGSGIGHGTGIGSGSGMGSSSGTGSSSGIGGSSGMGGGSGIGHGTGIGSGSGMGSRR